MNKGELIEAVRTYSESLTEQQLAVTPCIIWDAVEHYHNHLAEVRAWAE